MDTEKFKESITKLDKMRKGEAKSLLDSSEEERAWLEEFNLLDP